MTSRTFCKWSSIQRTMYRAVSAFPKSSHPLPPLVVQTKFTNTQACFWLVGLEIRAMPTSHRMRDSTTIACNGTHTSSGLVRSMKHGGWSRSLGWEYKHIYRCVGGTHDATDPKYKPDRETATCTLSVSSTRQGSVADPDYRVFSGRSVDAWLFLLTGALEGESSEKLYAKASVIITLINIFSKSFV